MRLILPLVCAAAALIPAAAAAQGAASSPATADARCLLAMVALSNSTDQNASRMGQMGVFYFAGRVKAHEPNYDFARLKPIAAAMTQQTAQTEVQRCGAMVESSMQQLQTALAPPPGAKPPAGAPAPTQTPGAGKK